MLASYLQMLGCVSKVIQIRSSDAGYAVRNPISGNREKLSVSGLSPAAAGLALVMMMMMMVMMMTAYWS